MPWIYFTLTFLFAILAGFAAFSRGGVFRRASGQILQGVLSLVCFAFIGWAFWRYGWKIGLVEVPVIFIGAAVGQSIITALIHR